MDYFYSSARIRTLEAKLLGSDAMRRLAEAPTLAAAYAILDEAGISISTDARNSVDTRERALGLHLESAYEEVAELTRECDTPSLFDMWRYPYDCNNVKALIKCRIRNVSADGMLREIGSVPVDVLKEHVARNDFSVLPVNMAEASERAISLYAKTENPQMIDLLLDRACYADMLSAARDSGVETARNLVVRRIDLTNLLTCVRILRMQSGEAGRSLLADAFLDGGIISRDELMAYYEMGERSMWERLLYSDYRVFAEAVSSREPSLTEIEKAVDNAFMSFAREIRFISAGPEVLIGFLLGVECEVRNLRVILAGKAAGLGADAIWERVRESYV